MGDGYLQTLPAARYVTSDPDGVVTALKGTLAIDTTTGVTYVNEDGSTGWWPIIIPTRAGAAQFFEFDGSNVPTQVNVVGTGAQGGNNTSGANFPGVWFQNTAAANDVAITRLNAVGILFGGGVARFRMAARWSLLSDGTNNWTTRYGWGDSVTAADHTDGVYLEASFAAHANNNWWLCAANNGTRTKVDTGIAVNSSNTYQTLLIKVNAAGTVADAWIDGVHSAAPVTTNIPTAVGRDCGVNLQQVKDLGAATRTTNTDYQETAYVFTTAR